MTRDNWLQQWKIVFPWKTNNRLHSCVIGDASVQITQLISCVIDYKQGGNRLSWYWASQLPYAGTLVIDYKLSGKRLHCIKLWNTLFKNFGNRL